VTTRRAFLGTLAGALLAAALTRPIGGGQHEDMELGSNRSLLSHERWMRDSSHI